MADHDPLALLREIEHRYRALEPDTPSRSAPPREWVGLELRIDGATVLIARDEIRALLPVPRVTRVPHVVSWVRGVARLRGRPRPVIDLVGFLRGRPAVVGRHTRVLVIDVHGDDAGLLVDGVVGHHTVPLAAISADSPSSPPWLRPYLAGAILIHGQPVGRFSTARLVEAHAFFRLAC
jgi:chemotaxis signal transduction protein